MEILIDYHLSFSLDARDSRTLPHHLLISILTMSSRLTTAEARSLRRHSKSTTTMNWLHTTTETLRTVYRSFLHETKRNDIGMLARAIEDTGDLSYIHGDAVMSHFLCHKEETPPSRQKATRAAEAASRNSTTGTLEGPREQK